MEYNDSKLVSERESRLISEQFRSVQALEINDLKDIYDRMTEQRNLMSRNNQDGKYNEAIDITNKNLLSLERIIGNQHRLHTARYNRSRILQNEPDVYGKIPSHDEMMRMNPPLNTPNDIMPDTDRPNNNINIPNNTLPNTPNNVTNPNNTPMSPVRDRTNRGFPMQGSIISNLAKSLFMKKTSKQSIDNVKQLSHKLKNTNSEVSIASYQQDIRDYFPYKGSQDPCDNSYGWKLYEDVPRYNPYHNDFMHSRENQGGGHPWHYLNDCKDCDRDIDYNKHFYQKRYNSDWSSPHCRGNIKYNDYCDNCCNNKDWNNHKNNLNEYNNFNQRDKFDYNKYNNHDDYNNFYKYNKNDNGHQDKNDDCDPNRKMVTGQIDVLRLLLLFVSLRPHCNYVSKVCQIAEEQFGILLKIID